ncbi:hypothetical protein DVH24_012492 [Malus domestica]|uniref:Transcription factor MYC/MYB N-terminal domain-containing protein n=1 Tax=Malus domestica TaxID=3750 RepID=A0A498HMS3_MALDO|nr:hypothetical protein DVH24_012492 [Malus domestica]
METGLPMFNCLLQHTLRNLCSCSDSSSNPSKWVYAVFWRILPRNYPPPKWDYGGSALNRSKGNKRNWILVWEDGFCDFYECEQAGSGYIKGRFGADVFFKMSHEVYNFGEGLVGKVAAENSHKWVFRDAPNEGDPTFISSWNASTEPQPRAWEFQFQSGIQTIAIISVREGIIQLGSFDKVCVRLPLFSLPISSTSTRQLTGVKRLFNEVPDHSQTKSINLGWNTPQNGLPGSPPWPILPLLPSISCSLGALLSKLPSVNIASYNSGEAPDRDMLMNTMSNSGNNCADHMLKIRGGITKIESSCHSYAANEEKHSSMNPNLGLENEG